MKKFVLIGVFVFMFLGCGGSNSGDNAPQYKTGDSVFIIKNIKKSIVPFLREGFKERFKGLPVVIEFKDYESESCISFGFKFKDVETQDKIIQTSFTKDDNSKCTTQDHSMGDVVYRGDSGLVMFVRIP